MQEYISRHMAPGVYDKNNDNKIDASFLADIVNEAKRFIHNAVITATKEKSKDKLNEEVKEEMKAIRANIDKIYNNNILNITSGIAVIIKNLNSEQDNLHNTKTIEHKAIVASIDRKNKNQLLVKEELRKIEAQIASL